MILLPGETEFFTHALLMLGPPPAPDIDRVLNPNPDGSFEHDAAMALTESIISGIEFEKLFSHVRKPWLAKHGHSVTSAWGEHDRYREWVNSRAKTLG